MEQILLSADGAVHVRNYQQLEQQAAYHFLSHKFCAENRFYTEDTTHAPTLDVHFQYHQLLVMPNFLFCWTPDQAVQPQSLVRTISLGSLAMSQHPIQVEQRYSYCQTRCSFNGKSAILWHNVSILIDTLLNTTCNFQLKIYLSELPNSGFIFLCKM